ncbi:MAG: hypothetical protein IKC69_00900 [Clostridia bacterium]|nr:hypothetical protein [Clostridia bacterium]
MKEKNALPLLLLDNSSMMSVLNQGQFRCSNVSFEEARHILEVHDDDEFLKCFSNPDLESIIFGYLGVAENRYEYKKIRNMRPEQHALVFKLYVTPSETQPIIHADDGVEAKKIQNVYVYVQHLVRVE